MHSLPCLDVALHKPADLGTEANVLKSYMNIGMPSSYQSITILRYFKGYLVQSPVQLRIS